MPADIVMLTEDPVSVEQIVSALNEPAIGAVATFIGVVRRDAGERSVQHLVYEAYPEMATSEMKRICQEVKDHWPTIRRIAIVHRTGVLSVGEVSVVIALSAAHREEMFDALHYAIDRLKEIVPIWKKEVWEGGGEEWKEES